MHRHLATSSLLAASRPPEARISAHARAITATARACLLAAALLATGACTKLSVLPKAAKVIPVAATAVALTTGGHVKVTVEVWSRFSQATGGVHVLSEGAHDVPTLITTIFETGVPAGEPVDLVFVVDTTGSMRDDIDAVKHDMRTILDHLAETNPDHRIGVVAYRDLGDDYVSQTFLPLSASDPDIEAAIDALQVDGGGDTPEHVYAGLDTALREQPWRPDASQNIILMGDAPPHEDYHDDPRNYDSVLELSQTPPLSVQIHTIGVHCGSSC